MNTSSHHPLLRHRDGHHAHVTYEELFFDLVYVFAVTQLSHTLLHHLSFAGAIETLVLWFAVWLGWQYTCWTTNWFNPEQPKMRYMLFVSMLLALIFSASIPNAFGSYGLIFAVAYVTMQLGRTAFIIWQLGNDHVLTPNHKRMFGWLFISACFWISGGFAEEHLRLLLWAIAIACEYFSPMIGFALPGFGRSNTQDWTIEGGHLAERCQLFVIVALGETLLATGATLGNSERWDAAMLLAALATFLGTLAMWWLYFGTSSKDATTRITRSDDPGKIGAYYHYIHAIFIAGIIACAVGNDIAMEHPSGTATIAQMLIISIGPIIYIFGSAIYKYVVYGRMPISHLAGVLALILIMPLGTILSLLIMGWLTTIIFLMIGFWDFKVSKSLLSNSQIEHH